MTSAFADRPLWVVAIGGNALSPPEARNGYATERDSVAAMALALNRLSQSGVRLLLVHGNGPQVGRLMQRAPSSGGEGVNLDIHVAQTQGELGYLLAAAMGSVDAASPVACLVTRARVSGPLGEAVKAVGPILEQRPSGMSARRSGVGWRMLVPSPRPDAVLELEAIRQLLDTHHVIAGGGGGVPVAPDHTPLECVIDKDWIASLLALRLGAEKLLFATNVSGVYRHHGSPRAELIGTLTVGEAQRMSAEGQFGAGSMAPKVAAACEFVEATGRGSAICSTTEIADGLRSQTGTQIRPQPSSRDAPPG